jgi:S1-C subfamily serine protease
MMSNMGEGTTSGLLAGLSNDLANAVETAGNSVVRVDARRGNASTGSIWTSRGHILTADHTIEREEDIPIGLGDGRSLKARLVARDPGTDLALLHVDATDLVAAEYAQGQEARIGNIVLALGRPGQAGIMASLGIVSALGGPWRTTRGSQIERFLRTDATLYPGFSGGPLIDAAGRVVAINSWTLSQGAGLAIPVDVAARVAEALEQGGVRRAYLGVSTQVVALPAAVRTKLGGSTDRGLMLTGVEQDGPAEKSGLLIGDVLLDMEGTPLHDTDTLLNQLSAARVGSQATFKLVRAGEIREQAVTLGQRT